MVAVRHKDHADLEIPRVRFKSNKESNPESFRGCLPGFLIKSCSGKPTVATVPPNFTARLYAMGNASSVAEFAFTTWWKSILRLALGVKRFLSLNLLVFESVFRLVEFCFLE